MLKNFVSLILNMTEQFDRKSLIIVSLHTIIYCYVR
jgi:hypothetical protein